MCDSNRLQSNMLSEAEFEPILQLLQGGDPDVIAQHAGITKEQPKKIFDSTKPFNYNFI